MAVREKYMQKCVIGDHDLALKADSGESILVTDIRVANPASSHILIHIEKILAGYFRVGGILGSHLPMHRSIGSHTHGFKLSSSGAIGTAERSNLIDASGRTLNVGMITDAATPASEHHKVTIPQTPTTPPTTLLGLLRRKEIFQGYPLAEGESLKITGARQTGAIQYVEYEVHDAGDITPENQNGTEAKEYLYINYGNAGSPINASGDIPISNPKSPAQFPNFPFGKTVDPQKTILLYGILASDYAAAGNDGTNWIHTDYLKLTSGRKTLFDQDMNGLLLYSPNQTNRGNLPMIGEGYSAIGNYSDVDQRPPLFFPEPITFRSGEELNIFTSLSRGGMGQNIPTDHLEIGLILKVISGGE